ncbi:MAG: hypothetical protein AAGA15_00475 [Pseudomonadota bacterium]
MLSSLKRSRSKAGVSPPATGARQGSFALVHRPTRLEDVERVERHLPEILGRAMARSWIDAGFSEAFLGAPRDLLERYDVYLPNNVSLVTEMSDSERPRVVVYEVEPNGDRRRLMYLQLVMLAGR